MECLNCNKITSNPKFCSRSCSASYSNRFSAPKRKKTKRCATCEELIFSRVKYCSRCYEKKKCPDMTIKEAMYEVGHLHRSSVYSKIRSRARKVCKDREQKCSKCSYDKHVETCHIRGISDFPEDTLISVVNAPENLILLCPNCHWELDNL